MLKASKIIFKIFSGIQVRLNWVLWLKISHKATIKVNQGCSVIWRLFSAHSWVLCRLVRWGPGFLAGHGLVASLSSLSYRPLNRAAHNLTSGLHHNEKAREEDRSQNLFVAYSQQWHSPFLSYSVKKWVTESSLQSREKNYTGREYQKAGIIGSYLSYSSMKFV